MNDRILTSEQAFEKLNTKNIIVVDVRRPDEWQKTGVGVGVQPICMADDDFLSRLAQLTDNDKNKPIAVICAAGGRSARVAQALSQEGYNFVYDISEGMNGGQYGKGWVAKGIPTVSYTL